MDQTVIGIQDTIGPENHKLLRGQTNYFFIPSFAIENFIAPNLSQRTSYKIYLNVV